MSAEITESTATELQKLAPTAIIELFQIDLSVFGDDIYYFHAGTNELIDSVRWQGQDYVRYPVQASGFEISSQGALPQPKLVVANTLSAITALMLQYRDLLGAKVVRKRTFKKFLDAENFTAGNDDADPDGGLPDDIWFIERKASENRLFVEFVLSSSFDLTGVQLPRRQIVANLCTWRYRGGECGYAGTDYFTAADVATTVGNDVCGKRLSSCKARFGEAEELPFGSFPGSGLIR